MKKINALAKKRISKTWMANFSANVAGVIIGIVLTFGVGYLVQQHQERKQVHKMMVLVRQELQENKQWLQDRKADYKKDFRAYQVLAYQAYREKISKDSLFTCINQFRQFDASSSSLSAWNMFQNSGAAQQLNDVDLVARLSECYTLIGKANEWWNEYSKAKDKASEIPDVRYDKEPYAYVEALAKNEESRNFLTSYVIFNRNNQAENFELISTYVDFVLELIDKNGNYNYESKIGKDDFETFRKNKEIDNK